MGEFILFNYIVLVEQHILWVYIYFKFTGYFCCFGQKAVVTNNKVNLSYILKIFAEQKKTDKVSLSFMIFAVQSFLFFNTILIFSMILLDMVSFIICATLSIE